MTDTGLWTVEQKTKQHFHFLYESGFRVSSSKYEPEDMRFWEINLLSKEFLVQLYNDRGEIMMRVGVNQNRNRWHALETVIFYISKGQDFVGNYEGQLSDIDRQMQRLANLLQKYYNQIQRICGVEYEKHEDGLDKAYNALLELMLKVGRGPWSEEELMKYFPKD